MENGKLTLTASGMPSAAGVKGKTIVDHKIRLTLGLTMVQYAILDLIHQHNKEFSEKPITRGDFHDKLGLTDNEIVLATSHENFGKYYSQTGARITTTDLWNKHFNNDLDGEFEVFWKIRANGSKQKAKIAYFKCRKLVDRDVLLDAYKKYLAFIDHKGRYQKDVSTWLNPETRSWEDDYSIVQEPNKDERATTLPGDFFSKQS